jgi:hypothetical protein
MYNKQKIDNAKVLEDMKIIESLNKYRWELNRKKTLKK